MTLRPLINNFQEQDTMHPNNYFAIVLSGTKQRNINHKQRKKKRAERAD